MEVIDFKSGERIELHPATDLWMSGARYGTVEKVTACAVHVRLDAGRLVKLRPDLIQRHV